MTSEGIRLQWVRRTYSEAGGRKLRLGLAGLRNGRFSVFLVGLSWPRYHIKRNHTYEESLMIKDLEIKLTLPSFKTRSDEIFCQPMNIFSRLRSCGFQTISLF